MKTPEIITVLHEIDKLGIAFVTITGGEPLLRYDISEICKQVKLGGYHASLNTNGTLINKNNAESLSSSFDIIRVSLEADGIEHEKIRGHGRYHDTIKGIKMLHDIKNRRAKIIEHIVLDGSNNNISDIKQRYSHLVDSLSFMPKSNYSIENGTYNMSVYPLNVEGTTLIKVLKNNKLCDAARLYMSILPNGDVTPCMNRFKIKLGNLRTHSLKDIINTPLSSVNKKQIDKCNGCHSKCTTEISSIMRKNPFELALIAHRIVR
jgi:MoaA/NifB/PqqE/SkfB family radical SAM enzyme